MNLERFCLDKKSDLNFFEKMIPKAAKIVFDGERYTVYQRDQMMYDGTCKNFEAIQSLGSAQVICTKGDKIVLSKQQQPHREDTFFSFFGGMLDEGEEPIDGAKRELLEESGMTSENMFFYKRFNKMGFNNYSNFFVAKDVYKIADQNLDNGEKIEVVEMSFDEVINLIVNNNFRTNLEFTIHIMSLKINNRLDEFKNILFN